LAILEVLRFRKGIPDFLEVCSKGSLEVLEGSNPDMVSDYE
jgi:hypothetical protein